ncbi:hypothetical protein GE061_013750 [Apolygus lucorum]|uniref:Lipid-binding serum glycoprotein N-terminal domain-containing protein n=1 Tax=Apolygus lucorum TaxID=248454 RepID=A0A6A4K9R3_APOLU|nr:hypothetical protein GE061_013750 [Apolygus lucorum]
MLVFLAVVALLGSAVQAGEEDVTPTCRAVNAEVDGALRSSDYLMHIQSGAYWLDDFSVQLTPTLLGVGLPFKMSMDATNGMVRPLDSLTRNGTATGCSSQIKTVQVPLRYDNLQVTYDATSQFLLHKVPGKLVINLDPVYCDVLIVQGVNGCRLGDFSAKLTGSHFHFIPNSSSWLSSMVANMLSSLLQAQDDTPTSSITIEKLQANVNTLFVRAWCELSLF